LVVGWKIRSRMSSANLPETTSIGAYPIDLCLDAKQLRVC
jgi:hypothetical protein